MFSQSRQLKLSHFQKLNFVAQTVTAKGTRSIPVDSIVLEKQKLVFAALIVSYYYMKHFDKDSFKYLSNIAVPSTYLGLRQLFIYKIIVIT